MVIGPKELEQKIRQEQKPLMEQLEQKIDEALQRSYSGRGSVSIDANSVSGLNQLSTEEVIGKYKLAGWDIKYHSDQRDGSFYQFKEQQTQDFYDPRESNCRYYNK